MENKAWRTGLSAQFFFTNAWEQRKLGDIAPLRAGYAFSSEQYSESGIPIVRISNILSNGNVGGDFAYYQEQNEDSLYSLEKGDILLAMSGATTGKVAVIRDKKACKYYQNQRVGLFLRNKNVDYSFVVTIVNSEKFISQLRNVLVAAAQPNVSSKDINSFEFQIPKTKSEQEQIGRFISNLDHLITLHQRKCPIFKKGNAVKIVF